MFDAQDTFSLQKFALFFYLFRTTGGRDLKRDDTNDSSRLERISDSTNFKKVAVKGKATLKDAGDF
jgi:hypothetical protein